ncbi:zinc finger protein ZAT12-like [Zingiber officinale]|nr:zinc finger protein ZAT12-like [Zingiber officinale]
MKRDGFRGGGGEVECIRMANVLMLLSQGGAGAGADEGGCFMQFCCRPSKPKPKPKSTSTSGRVFECKTCNRRFPSFQALGSNCASHKKRRLEAAGDPRVQDAPGKMKVHECFICGLEFSVGQALGGHMRRHRVTVAGTVVEGGLIVAGKKAKEHRREMLLDLNLPPLENDLKLGLGLENLAVQDKTIPTH